MHLKIRDAEIWKMKYSTYYVPTYMYQFIKWVYTMKSKYLSQLCQQKLSTAEKSGCHNASLAIKDKTLWAVCRCLDKKAQ